MEDEKELEAKLKQFPSNFDLLEEVEQMSKEYAKKVKEKLLQEHESTPYDTNMETLRAWNLISFLSFVLGNEAEAFTYNSKVLELSKDNIVGLCNKAWFLLKKQEQYCSIRDICKQLKEHIASRAVFLTAKAEIAFCYSRFGVKRYEKSRLLFKEVLDECAKMNALGEYVRCTSNETEYSEHTSISTNSICIWTFGYALTFKRMLNFNNIHDASSLDLSKQTHVTLCVLYSRIIDMKGRNRCLDRYKARSYVEIGSLVYNARKNKGRFPNGVKDILPEHRHLWKQTETYYTTAVELCPDDIFVLERSGKYFRYINKIEKSIELLKKAIAIRDTAFSHHHLALSLKRQIERESQNTDRSIDGATDIASEERLNVSRNLLSKFEKAEGSNQSQKPRHRKTLTKSYSSKASKSAASSARMTAEQRQQAWYTEADKTDVQTPHAAGLSEQLGLKRQDLETDPKSPTSHAAATCPTNLLHDPSTEHISDMLKHTSLDSAYESMLFDSNLPQNEHYDDTLETSGQLRQSTRSNRKDISSYNSKERLLRKEDYTQGWNNNSQNQHSIGRTRNKLRSYSSGKKFERSISEQPAAYHYRGNTDYLSKGRPGRMDYRSAFRKGRSLEGHHASSDRTAVINMLKSPQKPKYIDKVEKGETIEKIIYHLDKSVEKSNNCGAIYDKGILYRQTEQHREALATFKTLIRNEGGYCSHIQLSNAFEQAGLCLYDILCESGEENESLEYDMRMYFKKSIEISCMLVSKIPFLKDCWVSAPTLHAFLSGKAKTKETLKDLSFLFKKFENYGEAITVLNELKKLSEDEIEKAKIDLELVQHYLCDRKYDDAVLALDMIMCLPDGYTLIDENLYLRVHIDGGIDALKNGDSEMARLRLRNALDFHRCKNVVNEIEDDENESDQDKEENSFDIFILCNTNTEDRITNLMKAITEFTLRVTLNFLHVMPGELKLSGICHIMRRSKHVLLICDDEPLEKRVLHYFEMMQEIIFERGYGHIVILTANQDVVVHKHISLFPRIYMDLNFNAEDTGTKSHENELVCEKIKELLTKLACSKGKV
ncbi:uncharacterized protein LOC123549415 [Mercenaria mercenaria]|uniref:uncharacterized protein LOC123549415 n=1 Tax=Mercenaria mercenaria TaxID=6596 RepID=UPI00234F21A0|nr:uncharacterized protein LOC123549415 [Mercenaria mercenaria]